MALLNVDATGLTLAAAPVAGIADREVVPGAVVLDDTLVLSWADHAVDGNSALFVQFIALP